MLLLYSPVPLRSDLDAVLEGLALSGDSTPGIPVGLYCLGTKTTSADPADIYTSQV